MTRLYHSLGKDITPEQCAELLGEHCWFIVPQGYPGTAPTLRECIHCQTQQTREVTPPVPEKMGDWR